MDDLRTPPSPGKRQLVVVGGGMVAHRLVEALTARDRGEQWSVDVFAEESRPPYDRVALTSFFSGRDGQDTRPRRRRSGSTARETTPCADPMARGSAPPRRPMSPASPSTSRPVTEPGRMRLRILATGAEKGGCGGTTHADE
jgi:hypothetical protein